MREKLALCLLLICLQCSIEDRLKVGGGGGGGGSNGVSLGHEFVSRARVQVSVRSGAGLSNILRNCLYAYLSCATENNGSIRQFI
jgi:hypothetical protein